MEEWKPVVGYEGLYEVSDQGRVRSLDRTVRSRGQGFRLARGVVLSPETTKLGYKMVVLSKDSHTKHMMIHRAVAEAFIPNPLGYDKVRHRDDDKSNNKAGNLAWGTHWDNTADMYGFTEISGRVNICARGHELIEENRAHGRRCYSCTRAWNTVRNRKKSAIPLPLTREQVADIYYVAMLRGHAFSNAKRYSIEELEDRYGQAAKEWRASFQNQTAA